MNNMGVYYNKDSWEFIKHNNQYYDKISFFYYIFFITKFYPTASFPHITDTSNFT